MRSVGMAGTILPLRGRGEFAAWHYAGMPGGNLSLCPGCGLKQSPGAGVYDGYYRTSPECWLVYTEVLGREFSDVILFSQVHQLTVDTYALQHAGGDHKDKSVCVHLVGLHLVFERGIAPRDVVPRIHALANRKPAWPHFEPPAEVGPLTVGEIAAGDHEARVREWAAQVWAAWAPHHAAVAELLR